MSCQLVCRKGLFWDLYLITSFINLFSVMLFRAVIISIIDITFMLSFMLFLKQVMHLWSKTRLKAVLVIFLVESQMI